MDDEDKYPKELIPYRQAEMEAEAKAAIAEARKFIAEADMAQAAADLANVQLAREQRKEKYELASDYYNHVFMFDAVVNAGSVDKCIDQLTQWMRNDPQCDIEIIFNSPGGSITDGFALYDFIQFLRSRGHRVTTSAIGMAASMAGVLLQAGDKRIMGAQAVLLIHEASFAALGKTGDVEDTMELVKKLQKRIINIFAERSNMSPRSIEAKWKRRDWWLDSDEALTAGFVDEVR